MSTAAAVLTINMAIALLFAASFIIIDRSYGRHVAARGFAVSYLVGTVAPISEFLILLLGHTTVLSITSYGGLLGGLLLMGVALIRFYGRTPDPLTFIALFITGLSLRIMIWDGRRDWLPYELAFQLPFAAATFLCGGITLRLYRDKPLSRWLAVVFMATGAHFLIKPFAAAALGSGPSARAYAYSSYALFSQASSGVLLTATGLMALLVVFQKAVTSSERQAETDPLTELANRRGFDRLAKLAFERASKEKRPISAIMLDLDHFKAVNDRHGHALGDAVLVAFARLIEQAVPASSVIGRMGGEEFAIILIDAEMAPALKVAETIRIAMQHMRVEGVDGFTTSGGIVERLPGESLKQLLRAADLASYHAKSNGRNQISQLRFARESSEANPLSRGMQEDVAPPWLGAPIEKHARR